MLNMCICSINEMNKNQACDKRKWNNSLHGVYPRVLQGLVCHRQVLFYLHIFKNENVCVLGWRVF